MRKYQSEFGINMFGVAPVLLQQDALDDPRLLEGIPSGIPYHIYMITRRPRIGWEEESLHVEKERFSGVLTVQRGPALERHPFVVKNSLGRDDVRVLCPYPHTHFSIVAADGSWIGSGKVALAMAQATSKAWDLMDLEVLYVGQAYGQSGSRLAPDRLRSHATLQGIYAEAMQRSPDQEIWIILWSFEPQLIMSVAGNLKEFGTTSDEDVEHLNKVVGRVAGPGITEQQQINFTEAALIRYFRPEYNVLFKDSFPNPAHQTYTECYKLDLNSIIVELQTEQIMARLWSGSVPAAWVHFAKFQFHSVEERAGMFDLGHL